MKRFKSVLLIRLPFCLHPHSSSPEVTNFRARQTFRPIPSLTLASLCAFFEKYKSYDYSLKAIDLNIEAYTTPGVPINISVYQKLLNDCIENNSYDVLALSVMLVYNIKWVDEAVMLSRKYHPDSKIVIG
jgi:hypothetical protein